MDTRISTYLGPGFFYSVSTVLAWNEWNNGVYGKSRVVGTQILPRRETAMGKSELMHKGRLRLAF